MEIPNSKTQITMKKVSGQMEVSGKLEVSGVEKKVQVSGVSVQDRWR